MKGKALCSVLLAGSLMLLCAGGAMAQNCNKLEVLNKADSWLIKKVDCETGKVLSSNRDKVVLHDGYCKDCWSGNQQNTTHRIDCTVTFVSEESETGKNEVRVTQNYCALKAGNIHVRQVSGLPPTYTSKEGSFRNKRAGKVEILGWGENPKPPDWLPKLPGQ